jgi:large conductance mechanosensitive channel
VWSVKGFREFIFRGNVVDLAVAFVVGAAFTAVVKSFVADMLTPLIAAIVGKPNFASLHFSVHHSVFFYGDLVNSVIAFVSVAAVVYFAVVLPLNALAARRTRGETVDDALPADIALLTEIRDLLAHSTDGDRTGREG